MKSNQEAQVKLAMIRRPKGAGRKTPFIGKIRRKPQLWTGR